jgi:DNA anti-recombination protein RmuC
MLFHSPLYSDFVRRELDPQECCVKGLETHRRNKLQPETARSSNTRDYQMVKDKRKNLTNRNQDYLAPSEPSTPTTVSPEYPNILQKQDSDLKSHLVILVENLKDINNSPKEIQVNTAKQVDAIKEERQHSLKELHENTGKDVEALKEEIQNSLKELQENTGKEVEALKEETQKSLKELQKSTTKQVKELNKTILQDLKMEIETIKKSQRETTLEIEILGKKSGAIDASITNRI